MYVQYLDPASLTSIDDINLVGSAATMDDGSLEKDLEALVRVRNRLARSPDSALPKVLAGLLPRLLERLERNHIRLGQPTITEAASEILEKTQVQLKGILSHSLERIKGGLDTLPPGAPWIPTLFPLLEKTNEDSFENPLVTTFLLLILQNSVPRCINEDEFEAPPDDSPDITAILPPLLVLIHQLHSKMADLSTTTDAAIPESLLLNYRTATWICFDVVALTWGLPALMEWDRDFFDEYDWCTPTSAKEAFLEHGPSRHPHNNSYHQRTVNYLANQGSFHLWLDLLLFWPAESRLNRRFVRTNADVLVENSTGMTPEGVLRLNHRRSRGKEGWSVRYLRELKLACMECVVIEHLRSVTPSTFVTTTTMDETQISMMRSLVLCILTASTGSMHGKIAIEYVNKVGLMLSTSVNHSNNPQPNNLPHLSSSSNVWGYFGEGSLLLACSLLSLVLGDQLALKVLKKHSRAWGQIEAVIGPFAQKSSADAMRIEEEEGEAPLQRKPMPFGVAERAMDFILTHLLPPGNAGGALLLSEAADRNGALLSSLIDLLVQLPISTGVLGSYWTIQGLERLSKPISLALKTSNEGKWIRIFEDKCLNIASQVLSQIAEVDSESTVQFGEIQQPRDPHQLLPGGVPGPFGGRRDLNMMLAQHRGSQKKRQLQVNCALQARQTAYQMVADLIARRDIGAESAIASDRDKKSSTTLEMPNILLKCASGEEDTAMHPYVNRAIDAVLAAYQNAIPKLDAKCLKRLAASLLPSLLCAVCADSSVARLAAARWAVDFVSAVDLAVMLHVCAFLKDDIEPAVSGVAKKALRLRSADLEMADSTASCLIDILDQNNEQDKETIRNELKTLVEATWRSIDLPLGVAGALLGDFKYDVKATIDAYKSDQATTLDKSGLSLRCDENLLMKDSLSPQSSCGICYDEMEENNRYEMACGHKFCISCWRSYLACELKERFSTSAVPLHLVCPEQICNNRVLADSIQTVAPDLLHQWEDLVLRSYVGCSKHLSWCPGPDCNSVAHASPIDCQQTDLKRPVQCSQCSTCFCFSCGSDPHEPANCDDFAEWNRIFGSSQYWVKKNAKPCPNCKAPIEKNQGCNHMRCSMCRHDFCWLCLGHLRTHLEPHICNRYEPHQSAEDDEERRALFFTDRFKAHDDAEMCAKGELRSFEEKKNKLASETLWFASDEDLDNILHANRTLVRARSFLKNSYVAAWAMRKDLEHRDDFESHQANLELFTEKLSQLLLTKVQQLYTEQGARAIHMHFRAMVFSTASVISYMDRMGSST